MQEMRSGANKASADEEMASLLEEMDSMSQEFDRVQQENMAALRKVRKSDEQVSALNNEIGKLRIQNSKLGAKAASVQKANSELQK